MEVQEVIVLNSNSETQGYLNKKYKFGSELRQEHSKGRKVIKFERGVRIKKIETFFNKTLFKEVTSTPWNDPEAEPYNDHWQLPSNHIFPPSTIDGIAVPQYSNNSIVIAFKAADNSVVCWPVNVRFYTRYGLEDAVVNFGELIMSLPTVDWQSVETWEKRTWKLNFTPATDYQFKVMVPTTATEMFGIHISKEWQPTITGNFTNHIFDHQAYVLLNNYVSKSLYPISGLYKSDIFDKRLVIGKNRKISNEDYEEGQFDYTFNPVFETNYLDIEIVDCAGLTIGNEGWNLIMKLTVIRD